MLRPTKQDNQPLVFFFVFSPTPRGKPLVFTPRWSEADWVGKYCRRSIKICRQISRCVRKYTRLWSLSEWVSYFKFWTFDTLLLSVFNHFPFSHAVFARISRRSTSIPDRSLVMFRANVQCRNGELTIATVTYTRLYSLYTVFSSELWLTKSLYGKQLDCQTRVNATLSKT